MKHQTDTDVSTSSKWLTVIYVQELHLKIIIESGIGNAVKNLRNHPNSEVLQILFANAFFFLLCVFPHGSTRIGVMLQNLACMAVRVLLLGLHFR